MAQLVAAVPSWAVASAILVYLWRTRDGRRGRAGRE